jgi:hypothetical protein
MGRPERRTRLTKVWMWLSLVKYSERALPPLFLAASRSSTTFLRRGNDVKIPISSLIHVVSTTTETTGRNSLLARVDPILLRSDQIKQRLRTTIQLVQLPLLRLRPPRPLRVVRHVLLVEDPEQESPVVERAVLYRVVQLRHARRVELLRGDVAEVLEELLPALAEEEGLVAATPRRKWGRRIGVWLELRKGFG